MTRLKWASLLLALCLLIGLTACENPPADNNSSAEPVSQAESVEESKQESELGDNSVYYDAITQTLTLDKPYEGKNFLTDGIGKATVSAYTDGDTTRFRLESGETIIIRYYEIDTPESTSSIEKWGKAASNFTKSRLSGATEIVLEATGPRAMHDSYGTRYLGYVWYKTEGSNSFKNLNMEIVENGFSDDKGIDTEDFPYYSYFHKANQFAKKSQLRLFSKLDDPLYSTDPVPMTLKEFEDNNDLYYNPDTDTGAKVRLQACLTSLYISDSGTYTFTATELDPETGKARTINVYAGYTSSAASNMKIGHLYEVVGNLQKYGGKFQISGLNYNSVYQIDDGDYTIVKQKDYYLAFDADKPFLTQYSATLYGDVTVTEASVKGTTMTVRGTAQQKNKNGYKDETSVFTFRIPVEEGTKPLAEGSKFSVSGYQFEYDTGIIDVQSSTDLKLK